jgi:DNA modification methylase
VNNPRSIHGIYPYRGKISALDAEQILSQMPKGSIVLDPFCGSGTIVYEGLKFGLNTIGIDANPIAVVLSNGKIHIPKDYVEVEKEIEILIKSSININAYPEAPEYPKSLFHIDSLLQIMRMSVFYEDMSDYVKACFLGSIALTARGCNNYKWTSSTVGKNIEPKRYIPFYEKFKQKCTKHFLPIENNSRVFYADSRKLLDFIKPNSIDFIFSSPPYFDCLDYTAYYARIIYDILGYERVQIRSSLIQNIESYKEDMRLVLDNLYTVLKPGGQVIFVVGDKKIDGKVINGADYFQNISPFGKYEIVERSYTGTSSKVFDEINKTNRKEQIIIWTK